MRTLLTLACLCLLACYGCKKNSSSSNNKNITKLEIRLSNIPDSTSALISFGNLTPGTVGLRVFAHHDTTLYLEGIKSGMDVSGLYNFTYLKPHTDGLPGTGTVRVYYGELNIFSASNGSGNIQIHIP